MTHRLPPAAATRAHRLQRRGLVLFAVLVVAGIGL